MRNIFKNQKGIAHLGLILVIVGALGAVGFVGYNVYKKNTSSAASTVRASLCGSGYTYRTSSYLLEKLPNGRWNHKAREGKILVYSKGSGSNKTWCAFLERTGAAKGKKGYTEVAIGTAAFKKAVQTDKGNFSYYAGPVKFKTGKIAEVHAKMNYGKRTYSLQLGALR